MDAYLPVQISIELYFLASRTELNSNQCLRSSIFRERLTEPCFGCTVCSLDQTLAIPCTQVPLINENGTSKPVTLGFGYMLFYTSFQYVCVQKMNGILKFQSVPVAIFMISIHCLMQIGSCSALLLTNGPLMPCLLFYLSSCSAVVEFNETPQQKRCIYMFSLHNLPEYILPEDSYYKVKDNQLKLYMKKKTVSSWECHFSSMIPQGHYQETNLYRKY